MMKTYFSIFAILFSVLVAAQINPKTKWGNVSQEEIDYKEVPYEKNADAVILYETGDMLVAYYDLGNTIYKRIKILTEKGKQQANQEILYYDQFGLENIKNLKAQTINFENGKKVISTVKNKDIYDVPYFGYYRAKRFAFPNVKVGSVIEFEYTLINEFHYYIEGWTFQHNLPTLYSSFNINVQVAIDYIPICMGDKLIHHINQEKKKSKHKSSWTLTDIPSLENPDYIYNPKDFEERIDFQLRGYYNKNNKYVKEMITWKDLNNKLIEENQEKEDELTLKTISNKILNDKYERPQFTKILDYFSKNYQWNEDISVLLNQSLKQVDQTKKGSSSELNLLLHNLLIRKGINSKLVLIGIRNHRKIQTIYPYFNQFSTTVNLITFRDGTSLFIDASYLPKIDYEFMPLRNYNHYGLILESFKENFVAVNPPVSEYHSTQNYVFSNDKVILSKIDKSNGYFNTQDITWEIKVKSSFDLNFSEKNTTAPTLIDDKYKGIKTTLSAPINLETFYTIQNPLNNIINQYKFHELNRERALEFNFPVYYKVSNTIKIPEGYSVEIPNNFATKNELENKDLIYYQNAEIKDENLIFSVELLIAKPTFSNLYKEVKAFFEKSNLDASKTILLKKN